LGGGVWRGGGVWLCGEEEEMKVESRKLK
jgi:hypothetical protein